MACYREGMRRGLPPAATSTTRNLVGATLSEIESIAATKEGSSQYRPDETSTRCPAAHRSIVAPLPPQRSDLVSAFFVFRLQFT